MTVTNGTSPTTNGTTSPTNVTTSPTNGTTPVNCSNGLSCYNGGRCNSTYNCICPDGYQGYDCSRESCEGRCRNNGTCNDGYCSCSFGYSGQYCENLLEVCGLAPNRTICYNNGSCVNNSCVCTSEYTGQSCTDYVCDPPCMNNAYCSSGNYCSCSDGFRGSRCEIAPGPVCGSSYCYNNGTCDVSNVNCTCVGNYLPPYCRLRACAQPCQNNASCYDGYCSCPFGYTGQYCETVLEVCGAFNETICYNNGTCENNTCNCVYPYTGSDCSYTVTVTNNMTDTNTTTSPTNGTTPTTNGTTSPTNGTAPPTNGTTSPTNGTTPVYCGGGLTCYNGGRCNRSSNCICPDGYQGYDCSRESCEGRCRNNGTCYDGYCSCSYGYSGQYCENVLEVCGRAPNRTICYNNGSCVNDRCVCTSEYTGQSCTDYVCDPPCMNGGYCSSGNYCSCSDGFRGSRCEIAPGPVCGSSYCYNNGTCDVSNGNCTCVGNYLPPYCRLRACAQPCQNNASCYDGYCSCTFGYTGQYCETELEVCGMYQNVICYNNGTCDDNNTCSCPYPYTGYDCNNIICEVTCYNGGTCFGNTCRCPYDYIGASCETYNYCRGGCYNGGQCVNGTCNCPHPYTGYGCYQEICDPPCQNSGYCYSGMCSCNYGFSGSVCEIAPGPECDGYYCWNNGICNSDDKCVCTSSYTGRHCESEICPYECMNNGSCYNQRCHCMYGFNGTQCEIPPGPQCGSYYCWNNGTCSSNNVCECRDPFYGPSCTNKRCSPECQNNGSCYYGYCSCPFGYSGERCENEITTCGPYSVCYNGTCSANNTCVCFDGYTGYGCSERTCDPECRNGAYCYDGYCSCPRGYRGRSCEIQVTPRCGQNGSLCYNGTCVNNTCVCFTGYQGNECYERSCIPECQNGGFCYDGNCTCPHPYAGRRCEAERTLCGRSIVCIHGSCSGDTCVCESGYYGINCDSTTPTNETSTNGTSSPTNGTSVYCGGFYCYNGGSCNGSSCNCPPGFDGYRCTHVNNTYCPGGCFNGGQCVNGTCVCPYPYTGYGCYQQICDPPCENYGYCYDGMCSCSYGFSGRACEIAPGPECDGNYCWNNGICNSDNRCVCTSSYTGRHCREELCPYNCMNNGSCYDQRCYCTHGFNGTQCEIPPGPQCGSYYCWNNGTCGSNNVCECRDPFYGQSCNSRRCVPECQNNGTCFDHGQCYCPFGYSGPSCENQIATCNSFTSCYNGTCNANNTCVCFDGYTGYECSLRACNPECVNGGYCYDGNCYCSPGYGGRSCETQVTPRCGRNGTLCYNGTCVNSTCVCFTGYQGRDCYERSCIPECQNGGHCFDGNCTCPHPYAGRRCEVEKTLCGSSTICIYGNCVGDTCVCDSGYQGPNCDKLTTPNTNGTTTPNNGTTFPNNVTTFPNNGTNPPTNGTTSVYCGEGLFCYNGGTCNHTYNCICSTGYEGYQCQHLACVPACQNGAYCYDGTCGCFNGFSGRACEIPPGPECDGNYCWNNGICNSDNRCVCTSSYTGRHCREELCPYDCMNNGSCYQQTCYCPSGFNGTRCEIAPGPQCGSYYCWNNGTCGSNNVCECRDPFYGPSCYNKRCVPECQNNGTCSDDGYCYCPFGYSGQRCENQITTCGPYSVCYNGTCSANNTCVCFDGYTGYGCSERTCNPECANSGYCYDGNCYCSNGYGGRSCETQLVKRCGTTNRLCYNGTCEGTRCVCFTGYQGIDCFQRSCIPECQNGGHCFDGNCTCPHPYAGRRCEVVKTLCGSSTICIYGNCVGDTCVCDSGYLGTNCDTMCTCMNGGTCDDMGRCTCGALYTGPRCEIEIQLGCNVMPCQNGGTCLEGGASCQCTAEYTGRYCTTPVNTPCPAVSESITVATFGVTLSFSWPMTESTGLSTIQCPCAANPSLTNGVFATRRCGARGVWQETAYSSCVSRTFQSLCVTNRPISTDAIDNILSSQEPLEAGDVALVTKAITSLISSVNLTDERSRNMLLDSINSVLSVDSDVLSMTSQTTDTSNTIVENFETFGARIELPDSGVFTVSRTSYSLTITEVSSDNVPTTGYGVDFGDDTSDSFQLPKSLFNTGSTRVSASLIKSVGIFSGRDSTKVVASNVVSLTLNGRTVVDLQNSVIITITRLTNAQAGMVDTCQFWDPTAEGGLGGWSTEGCRMIGDNGNSISCACNHLTSFAIVQVPGSVSTPSNPGTPVNVAAIVVPVIFGVLIISLVVIAIIAAVLLYSKKKASYSVNTVDNTVIMENVGSSPELGSDEDTGERGVIEKEKEIEDMEKETPNV